MNLLKKLKQTQRLREQTCGGPGDGLGVWD